MSRKLILKNVRFSYVRVFEPEQFNGVGDFHYSVVLLIPKTDTALVKQINDAVKAEAQDYSLNEWTHWCPFVFIYC